MDIPNTSPFAAAQPINSSQDIPSPSEEKPTPAPSTNWSKDSKNRPKMTAGGVVLDVINWGILGGVINGALSIYMADKAGHGNWQPWINKQTRTLQKKFPSLTNESARHNVMMAMLCSGGFIPLPIIKYIEDHKLDLTHKLDDVIYGKDKTKEQQEKINNYYEYLHDVEAPQSWASVMGSRVVMLGTLIAIDKLALKNDNVISNILKDENNIIHKGLEEINLLKDGKNYSWEGITPKLDRFSIKMTDKIKKPLNIGDHISTKLEGTFLEKSVGSFFNGKLKGEGIAKFFTKFSNELDASAEGLEVTYKKLNKEYHKPQNGERLKDIIQANNIEWSYEGVTTAISYLASRILAPIFSKGSRSEMGQSFTYEEKQEKQEALESTGSAIIKKPKEQNQMTPSTEIVGNNLLTPELIHNQSNNHAHL